MKKPRHGGGWQAIRYTFRKGREAGGIWKLYRALRTRNACKTCALGMGGQQGGMVNEAGHFPEVCKKSIQAMVADMQGAVRDEFWRTCDLPRLRALTPRQLEASGRLAQPMLLVRGENHYRPISWEEAFRRVAEKLQSLAPAETFWYFSGRSSNEAGFLLQLLARLYGTNNVNNCSYYCHQASGVGLGSSLGTGTATVTLDDVERCDLLFVIGGNPPSNHPRLMTSMMRLRRRGGKIIVVNPVRETGLVRFKVPSSVRSMLFGTEIASLYLQPHIGGDLALLTGLAKRTLERSAHDAPFLAAHTAGWPEWEAHLQSLSWDAIEAGCGVSRAQLDEAAQMFAAAKTAVFSWTMGITHHAHGVENVQAIANLALLRGMVGRPHAGLMPIRGHSNVQGIGSMGVTPQLKEAVFRGLETQFGVRLPTTPGLDTLACMEQAAEGRLKLGFCLGGNLYGSNPDAHFAERALGRLEMLVYLNTTLNTGHAHGLAAETLILPVLARDEEPEPTTQESMFNLVRLSDGGPSRLAGPKSEVEVIATLGEAVLGGRTPLDWNELRRHGRIREAIGRVVPGFENLAEIDRTRQEFQIPGRTLHTPRFPTPDGKARLFVHSLPPLAGGGDELRLMTVRSEGQFNTVVYEESDLYRGQERRDVVLLHPDDLARLGLKPDDRVRVWNATGEMLGLLARPFPEIRPGNALVYYPEANVLVPRRADPLSRTPAFKNVLVRIAPLGAALPRA